MGRKYVDCRQIPSEMNCTIAISADSEDEVLEARRQHAVAITATTRRRRVARA
jgi:predicted small metal-binding protein